jgi:hypothetical protein
VNATNATPHLAPIGNKVAVVGQPLTFTVRATDREQSPLIFSADGLPAGATFVAGGAYGTAVFRWTPSAVPSGPVTVTFRVRDNGNGDPTQPGTEEQTITLVVRDANLPPALAPLGELVVAEGEALNVTLLGSDPDGDALTYSADDLPAGATLNPTTGALQWKPDYFSAGTYGGVVLRAGDGNFTASQTWRSASLTRTAPRPSRRSRRSPAARTR